MWKHYTFAKNFLLRRIEVFNPQVRNQWGLVTVSGEVDWFDRKSRMVLTDVQKIMKTAQSFVKNTTILHESCKYLRISMLITFFFIYLLFLTVIGKKTCTYPSWKHQPTQWPMQLKWGCVLGALGWTTLGVQGRGCALRETSTPQLPSVTTIHAQHAGKGLAVPTTTQLVLDLNKMSLNPFTFNTRQRQKQLQSSQEKK